MNMPASVQADFQGTAAAFESSLSNEALLILAALVTVYIVLGVLYESFIHPITILSTLPSAGVGALLALILFRQNLSVVAIIGIILLIGIVKKNGIMMVDFALEGERQHGKNFDRRDLRRVPAALPAHHDDHDGGVAGRDSAGLRASGIGSELRRPLGIAMVGGLLLSQVLTLYTTPVIYIFFDNLAQRFWPHSKKHAQRRQRAAGGGRHEHLRAIHPPAGSDDAADGGHRDCRGDRVHSAAGLSLAAGGLSYHFGSARPARRQRADHGFFGGHSAGAAVRPHRRRHRDDFVESAGQHQRHPAV